MPSLSQIQEKFLTGTMRQLLAAAALILLAVLGLS